MTFLAIQLYNPVLPRIVILTLVRHYNIGRYTGLQGNDGMYVGEYTGLSGILCLRQPGFQTCKVKGLIFIVLVKPYHVQSSFFLHLFKRKPWV